MAARVVWLFALALTFGTQAFAEPGTPRVASDSDVVRSHADDSGHEVCTRTRAQRATSIDCGRIFLTMSQWEDGRFVNFGHGTARVDDSTLQQSFRWVGDANEVAVVVNREGQSICILHEVN